MIIRDKVYSEFEITSPVILELIKTKALQRLKGISQFGVPDKYYHLDGFSRYDHSVGVYIFLNNIGASEEEQVAGLLHDISHTAFSHLVDWIIGDNSKEDYQDKRHLSALQEEKEIAEILDKYGFDLGHIADNHRFGLLERDIPDLCADRIDYVFRESDKKIVKQCLLDMKSLNSEIVFLSERNALLFAENFLDKQAEHWAGYESITRYVLFSDLLKKVMNEGVISKEDFLKTDDYIIDKIIKANKNEYLEILALLETKNLGFLTKSKKITKGKFRYVDPKVLVNGKTVTLSAINENFGKKLKHAKILNDKGVYYGVIV